MLLQKGYPVEMLVRFMKKTRGRFGKVLKSVLKKVKIEI